MEVTEKKLATKVRILKKARIVADPPGYLGRWCRNEEERAKEMLSWCKDFNEFIRDHRSQDAVHLSVERVEPNCCSACKAEWETYDEDGKTFCASCGTECAI